jgi:preprotein translocase subunit SecD
VGSSQKYSALLVIVVALAGAVYTLVSGNRPLLGLDLQGGVSVVLQPTGPTNTESLTQAVEILRKRVDALGVAEPEIALQGDTIVVDLPGVKEQQRALDLVGQTAELRFRPVLFDLGPAVPPVSDTTDTTGSDSTSTTSGDSADTSSDSSGSSGASTTTAAGATTGSTSPSSSADEQSLSAFNGRFGATAAAQSSTTASTLAADQTTTASTLTADQTTTTGVDDGSTTTSAPVEQSTLNPAQLAAIEACSSGAVTAPEADAADKPVLLKDENENLLCLGPTLLTGDALETAGATLDQSNRWTVSPVFLAGANGIDVFNQAAAKCYAQAPDPDVCPSGRLAIVLDHAVVSSPTINAQVFSRDQIVISGTFDEQQAKDLAAVLRYGALPVELETQQVRTVSATIGSDVLRAGVIAGLIGLALVALYLIAYYRLAALVTIVGLLLSATMLWSIISWFGAQLGLALTLGGVVGLIVSIGIAADSSIVYFENVKETYQSGRKLSTSVERAYQSAISTVVKADIVSLIAAALLYWLTVGAVRGFAFYLGLATLFDLVNSWLFMRPALTFLARRQGMSERPGLLLGIRSGGHS